jgi:hypothetical protein
MYICAKLLRQHKCNTYTAISYLCAPSPDTVDLFSFSSCQGVHCRELLHPLQEIGKHCVNASLLAHNFANPDCIRAAEYSWIFKDWYFCCCCCYCSVCSSFAFPFLRCFCRHFCAIPRRWCAPPRQASLRSSKPLQQICSDYSRFCLAELVKAWAMRGKQVLDICHLKVTSTAATQGSQYRH